MQIEDIEQKKLIYLAKTQLDLVILPVNTFIRDSDDRNPLIRALAICAMGCIHIEKIIDYLSGPPHKCLHDETHMFGGQRPHVLPSYMIASRN